jgi:hypothetical protein
MINKEVIIRADKAGVFFGTLKEKINNSGSIEVTLSNARKLWYWSGAAAVEQLAQDGVKYPNNCKFTCIVDELVIMNVIQILPCTKISSDIIKNVSIWKI